MKDNGLVNAKEELLNLITARNLTILKIDIRYEHIDCNSSCDELNFEYNTITKHITTLDELDFDYDSGYGIQELFGVVYCKDSDGNPAWLTRAEYDGSEWWIVNTIPRFYNTIK